MPRREDEVLTTFSVVVTCQSKIVDPTEIVVIDNTNVRSRWQLDSAGDNAPAWDVRS